LGYLRRQHWRRPEQCWIVYKEGFREYGINRRFGNRKEGQNSIGAAHRSGPGWGFGGVGKIEEFGAPNFEKTIGGGGDGLH